MTRANKPPRLSQESMARILDVTQKLAQPLDLLHMLGEVVEAGKSVLAADKAALWLYDSGRDDLVMRVPELKPAPHVAPGEGLVGECLATREMINVADAYRDPRFRGVIDRFTGYKTESVLCVPLLGWEKQPVGVLQLLNKSTGAFNTNDGRVAWTLAAQCAVAVQRAQLTDALLLNERLDEEVSLAREIQMSTLPTEMPRPAGYDVHGEFLPAGRAGGDLFDLVMLDGALFILVGDATGHGFGPALSATQMQAMLRVAFRCGADLDEAYCHVNNQLEEDLPDDRFITAFIGFLDPRRHEIRFHSGGQGPVLHFRADGERCEWHQPTTFPLGIMEMDDPGEAQVLPMDPGDVLVLLSDGVYEYESRQGVPFGEDRVGELLKYHHRLPAAELAKQILGAVFDHGKGVAQQDDITVVLVRRTTEESQ
ncbi:MAG: SpoIIE family protein phosphatase [Lysobacterales bacterium]|jgi:phosphoserine phosphatase